MTLRTKTSFWSQLTKAVTYMQKGKLWEELGLCFLLALWWENELLLARDANGRGDTYAEG